jgi:hypothetical protein
MEKSLNDIDFASGCHIVTPEHELSSCVTHNDQLGLVLHTTEHAPWACSASVTPEGEAYPNDSLGGIMCLSLGHILSYRNCAMGHSGEA